VGSHLKRPACPVFVVQSESHYSVLWVADGTPPPDLPWDPSEGLAGDPEPEPSDDLDDERPPLLPDGGSIDLLYFDQMAERDDAVRLTLRRAPDGGGHAAAHVSPLEQVILTRWPAATIDWNGEEIIL